MSDQLITKPYWKVSVTKTVTYNSHVYIRSWDKPNGDVIIKAIEETMSNSDWNEDDDDYDYEGIKSCEEKEANEYDIYDSNPEEPEEKIKVEYNPDQIVMEFINEEIKK